LLAPLALLTASTPALADDTVMTLGLTGDMRAHARTFSATEDAKASPELGARITFAFEQSPLELPPDPFVATDARLAPELLAGFLANDKRAEGFLGAGVRGELQIANGHRRSRMAMYTAARAIVIGKHQDGGVEFVIGGYILGRGTSRFGWEGGAMLRPHASAEPARSHEVDAMLTLYVGR
jgi:hypothetical protein